VKDDGPGPPVRVEPGHGLVGMRERVAAHAGELRTGAGPDGGFVVRATLPIGR
jgi:signal transduction histidine kinase